MKSSYIFFFFFFSLIKCFSQAGDIPVFNINSLPVEGILLDNGWTFHAGDSPAYARPEYDDSEWQSIDPTLDIHNSLPQIPRSGIVWFRLHLSTDSSITNELAMMIQQSGASEMYLNGKLIHRFGVLDTNPGKVKAFSPLDKPISLPLTNSTEQVLAVRYALQPHISYSSHWGRQNHALYIRVNTIENANEQYQQTHLHIEMIRELKVGVFLILGILYLAFYLFYPSQIVNLYVSLYAFLFAGFWAAFIYYDNLNQIELWFPLNNFLLGWGVVVNMIMLLAIYRLLEQKKGWIYYCLCVLGIISIPCGAYIYGWGWLIYGFFYINLINFDITRIAFKAITNHKKGAWIIAAGGICSFIFWLIVTLQSFAFLPQYYLDFFTLYNLVIPVSVSVYLGYDFALTNHSLQQKLAEVESLSYEKQQILTSQNETLEKQVGERTSELSQSLKELKETQSQLVQREKMASLGELTAGIAHEIQNPLNFVNNFSEVNRELLAEMKEEMNEGNLDEANAIANDAIDNEEKIIFHGKRADAIVKGMLQHSRASSGVKEPTDINALADEYLRLAYHGFRAKDKTFNAKFETDFDNTIGKINIVPQDIGRVFLNLINNAFYAVSEKTGQLDGNYEPCVSISSRKADGKVVVKVKDNGNGIPQKVLDKIFQPFFTTKPTGQGTGLGLSLSYDIIKAHGGQLTVETKENEGAEFIIQMSAQ